MLNPKTAVKLAPAALAVVAALGSPLSAFAAPAVTLGADNAQESSEQGTVSANVPVTIAADGSWLDRGGYLARPRKVRCHGAYLDFRSRSLGRLKHHPCPVQGERRRRHSKGQEGRCAS